MSFGFHFLFAVIVTSLIVVLSQPDEKDCPADVQPAENCFQYIGSACKNATLFVDRLSYGNNCSNISLFWGTPMYNMTIFFDTHVIGPYQLCLKQVTCAKSFYTTEEGNEIPIEWSSSSEQPVCFSVPYGGRPIMKFRFDAGDKWHCYGTFIDFSNKF